MEFLKLKIDNFLAIGNAPEIALKDKGLVLIQGQNEDDSSATSNGVGKSSIADALCWAIYGETARGITGDGVVNKVAKKNTSVEVVLRDGDIGYPVRKLKTYSGTTIVGFPTVPLICTLGMGDKLVTAAEATPEEQYQYLRLLEKYWIIGVAEDGVTPLEDFGNQISYTLKYDPKAVGFEEFKRTLLEGQSGIRCCSVMPQSDTSAYEYQPEQPVTKHEFDMIATAIQEAGNMKEDVDFAHVDCAGGACPVDFTKAA